MLFEGGIVMKDLFKLYLEDEEKDENQDTQLSEEEMDNVSGGAQRPTRPGSGRR